jgi:hypothetical protein
MLADLIPKLAGFEAEKQRPYKPRPSSAGPMNAKDIDTRCLRSMVYHRSGCPAAPLPDRAILTMDDSSWHEELTMDWLRKSTYKVHSEQMLIECHGRTGKLDFLVTDPVGKDYLVEHKAINHFSFERTWKGEIPWDYVHQFCDYSYGAQSLNPGLTDGFILLKNKNTAQYVEIALTYDKANDKCTILNRVRSTGEKATVNFPIPYKVVEESNKKFAAVEMHFQNKTLPLRPFDYDHWRCSYCPWNQTCYAGYEEEFEALAQDVALEQDIEDLCRYYLEVSGQAKSSEQELEDLKEKIKSTLKERGVRKGTAGPYNISLQRRHTSRLDQSLIPNDIVIAARVETSYEVINIRLNKKGKS